MTTQSNECIFKNKHVLDNWKNRQGSFEYAYSIVQILGPSIAIHLSRPSKLRVVRAFKVDLFITT